MINLSSSLIMMLVLIQSVHAVKHPEDFVNPLAGTASNDKLSTGNTLPIVSRPWGFNHWAPASTLSNTAWWFHPDNTDFEGIRCTHQPSPWIGDWAWFVISSYVGPHKYRPQAAELKPYLFSARFGPHGDTIDFAPTMHGGIMRIRFPSKMPFGKAVLVKVPGNVQAGNMNNNGILVTSTDIQASTGKDKVHSLRMFIRVEVEGGTRVDTNGGGGSRGGNLRRGNRQQGMKTYSIESTKSETIVRISTSFLSHEQASENMKQELDITKDFDTIMNEARAEWNELLSRVQIRDNDNSATTYSHITTFYTGLYRGLLFPRRLDETNSAGRVVHWSPYAGRHDRFAYPGPGVTDNGFWDTYRTVYPMLTLIYPDKIGSILEGWVNAYREGGWLPKWASPGYRDSMVGTYCDVVLADAIVKGVSGFDVSAAYASMLKDADETALRFGTGRKFLDEYKRLGFVSKESGTESTSRTLDFAFADFAIAEAARTLGKTNDETRLRSRAKKAYRSVFNTGTKLMGPRSRNRGVESQDGVKWGGAFTEGAPWHHTFSVPYDVEGLAELYGSKANLLGALQKMMDTPSTFQHGSYGRDIHEMVEFRDAGMGQYAANNQPMHSVLYLFSAAGDRSRTEAWVRAAMEHVFGPDFYQGDEDNGEMGSWYVLSALGIYPLAPGTDRWILGSPLFRDVKIVYPDRDPITILAENNSRDHVLVKSVTWRGQKYNDVFISHKELSRGGVFHFDMISKSSGDKILMPFEPVYAEDDADNVAADIAGNVVAGNVVAGIADHVAAAHQIMDGYVKPEMKRSREAKPPPPPLHEKSVSSKSDVPELNVHPEQQTQKHDYRSEEHDRAMTHNEDKESLFHDEHTLELPDHKDGHDHHDVEKDIHYPTITHPTHNEEDSGHLFRIASALAMMLTGIGILIIGVRKLTASDYDEESTSRRPRRKRVV